MTRNCADTMKKVSMELGGNAPFIVFDDADLECCSCWGNDIKNLEILVKHAFALIASLVQEGIYDEFVKLGLLKLSKH